MEDPNVLAADCLVLSCCCQCLILQIVIFILLKLPYKLVKKTKQYAKRIRKKRKERKIVEIEMSRYEEDSLRSHEGSLSIRLEGLMLGECGSLGCCMDEIDKVLEEFSSKGEFAFGSFWGAEMQRGFPSCLAKEKVDYDEVQYQLIQMFGSVSFQ